MTGREHDGPRRRADTQLGSRAGRTERARRSAGEPAAEPVAERPARRLRSARQLVLHRILGRLTTRRAALLALVVCALVLSVAVPLHTYLSQRADLQSQLQQQQVLRAQEAQLTQAQQRLSDTAQVEAEARTRFGYVMPGETPYVVQLPGGLPPVGPQPTGQQAPPNTSWYQQLWSSVLGNH
ncbi:MAG TPA: septum formation initiator family protein [Pseudonocardiaceae bacterium]|jgi:cell division protein FtsB|nr:septum formation initiator family protein [Pseudonocardiaceae bacterium]